MYALPNKGLEVIKEVSSFRKFWRAYQNHVTGAAEKQDIVIHFRRSTSGFINEQNAHPHILSSGDVAFAHNGTLIWSVPRDSPVSDTILFQRQYLDGLPAGFYYNPSIRNLIERIVLGTGSKAVFHTRAGETFIMNEEAGEWNDGCWFSNDTYRKSEMEEWRSLLAESPLRVLEAEVNEDEDGDDEVEKCEICEFPLFTEAEMEYGHCKDCIRDMMIRVEKTYSQVA